MTTLTIEGKKVTVSDDFLKMSPQDQAAAVEEISKSLGLGVKGGSSANPAAVNDFQNRLTTMGANAANAAAFGLGDESQGVKAGIASMWNGGDFLPAYQKERDAVRADMATINQKYPSAAVAGKLAGAAIPALATAPFATGKGLLDTGLRAMGIGSAEGALQGAGNADGRDLLAETLKGGLVGAGAGLAAPVVVGLSKMGINAFKEGIPSLLGKAVTSKANRALFRAMDRSGKTAQELDAMIAAAKSAGQPEFALVDALGLPGQRLANGLTRAGGAPGDEVAAYLASRQAGQAERVGSFVEDAFGVGGTTAAKTKEGLVKARADAANAAYDAARSGANPVDVRGALGVIDARTGGMKGSGVTGDGIDAKLMGYRSRLAAQPGPDGVMRELSDFDRVLGLKQAVQDDIGAAVRAGRNNEARELGKLVTELDKALEGASAGYRAANDGFRQASKVIDAVDQGAMMAARGRAADNVPKFGAMAAAERDAARVGYGDDLLKKLEALAAPTSNRAKPLLSPKRVAEANAMATDPKLYADRLARENTMWETQNRALGGSQTANNLADQEAMTGLAGGALDALRSAGNLNFGDTVAKIVAALKPLAKGQNEPTRALIAQALLSGNPAQALAPAIAQSAKSAKISRMLEAILRQPTREVMK